MDEDEELKDDEIPDLGEEDEEDEDEESDLLLPDEDGVLPAIPGEEDPEKHGFNNPEADDEDVEP
jgi:hypothetical protein